MEHEDGANRLEGLLLTGNFFAISVALLSVIGIATLHSPASGT